KKIIALFLSFVSAITVYFNLNNAPQVNENRLSYTCEDSNTAKILNDASQVLSVSLSKGDKIDLDFGKTVYFDTVALYESGDNCNEFRLYAGNGGEWTLIYQQDRILTYHLCYVEPVYADSLRLEIVDCKSDVRIRELSVYEAEKRTQPVIVTQYLRLDACDFETLMGDEGFSGYYDVVTDPILFGEVSLDENANISFAHGEEYFAKQLDSLRKIIGERPVRIRCCIVFDQRNENGVNDIELTKKFVNNNIEKISASIKGFVEKYDLYGVDYDWEYPQTPSQWRAYDLIVNKTAEFTKVSVAVAPWGVYFGKSARENIELVNIMAYDLFDSRGDHSNAYTAGFEAIQKLRRFGFEDEQILLGIPTYGRTTDKSGDAWPTIRSDGADFGKWGKLVEDYPYIDSATGEQKYCDAYLNSYAEVRDKTATAIDEGVAGVMVFRAFCDAPYTETYCLQRAIGEVVGQRMG
ncbi:MAG: glycoside hydrolase family 18 protein, partial [Acutalibacteraceae bacterium]